MIIINVHWLFQRYSCVKVQRENLAFVHTSHLLLNMIEKHLGDQKEKLKLSFFWSKWSKLRSSFRYLKRLDACAMLTWSDLRAPIWKNWKVKYCWHIQKEQKLKEWMTECEGLYKFSNVRGDSNPSNLSWRQKCWPLSTHGCYMPWRAY